jgi:hypothetical protein
MAPSAFPRPAASRQLADLLLGLASASQRVRMLPPGHPVIVAGVKGLERILAAALAERDSLTVEVGTVQLVIEGMETNPDFEPLRDLASQLREAGIAAIEFTPGVDPGELLTLLSAIAALGKSPKPWPIQPHIAIRTLPIARQGGDPWLTLERLVLEDPEREVATREPDELAFALEMLSADPARDGRVLESLTEVGYAAEGDPIAGDLLVQLLRSTPVATLRRLLSPRAGSPAQGAFLRAVAAHVPSAVLLRLLEATAHGREAELSPAALSVLARLARRTEGSGQGTARRALAEELSRLVPAVNGDEPRSSARLAPEPERILKLALESGILEPGTLAAAERMIARRQVVPLLALLETVPQEDQIASAIRRRVFRPETVRLLLDSTPVDLEALDRLIPLAGIDAATVLLDGLAQSRDRRIRLRLLDLLARYGARVGPLAAERLDGMPWYVQRNILALLGRLPDLPANLAIEPLLAHRDPRVRHEAIALALADPRRRDTALVDALESRFEPTLKLALLALAERCPPELVPRVIACAANQELSADIRALAVTALGPVHHPVVLRVLRRLVVARGITALGRLAPRSESMLAALKGLATHWHGHPKVVPLLEAASQSRDAEIREAARAPARRSFPSLPNVGR